MMLMKKTLHSPPSILRSPPSLNTQGTSKIRVQQLLRTNHLLVSHIHREARMTTVDYLSQVSVSVDTNK